MMGSLLLWLLAAAAVWLVWALGRHITADDRRYRKHARKR